MVKVIIFDKEEKGSLCQYGMELTAKYTREVRISKVLETPRSKMWFVRHTPGVHPVRGQAWLS